MRIAMDVFRWLEEEDNRLIGPYYLAYPSSVRVTSGSVYSFIGQDVLVSIVHVPTLATMVTKAYCNKQQQKTIQPELSGIYSYILLYLSSR